MYRKLYLLMVLLCVVGIAINRHHIIQQSQLETPIKFHEQSRTTIVKQVLELHDDNADQFLLSIPFYIYDELDWTKATFHGKPAEELIQSLVGGGQRKHTDDYWFIKAAQRHPMRTRNPQQAKLFVVPLLLNLYAERVYTGPGAIPVQDACLGHRCERQLIEYTIQQLEGSPWFQQNQGRDHIFVFSHWAFSWSGYRDLIKTNFTQLSSRLNAISFERAERNATNRSTYSSYYVGYPCASSAVKKTTFVFVGNLKGKRRAKFADRRTICKWILNATTKNPKGEEIEKKYSIDVCGSGPQCPALAEAKYGFHIRGDTFGSNRLMDTILSGTVPIFTRRKQYDILPSWIDWSQLSYFVDMASLRQETFLTALDEILKDHDGYQHRLRAVLQNRRLFDWTTLVPFDTYMFMLQYDVFPETILANTTSPYSALILPNNRTSNRVLFNSI